MVVKERRPLARVAVGGGGAGGGALYQEIIYFGQHEKPAVSSTKHFPNKALSRSRHSSDTFSGFIDYVSHQTLPVYPCMGLCTTEIRVTYQLTSECV